VPAQWAASQEGLNSVSELIRFWKVLGSNLSAGISYSDFNGFIQTYQANEL
jgi:hypothetical protein